LRLGEQRLFSLFFFVLFKRKSVCGAIRKRTFNACHTKFIAAEMKGLDFHRTNLRRLQFTEPDAARTNPRKTSFLQNAT
jgi:uncharacterized protein YjbI with pentapeptide repeats